MSQALKVSQRAEVDISAFDYHSNPTAVWDAPPTWSCSDPSKLAVEPQGNGLAALCTPQGPLGAVTLTVSGTSDSVAKSFTLDINLLAGRVDHGSLVMGSPSNF